MTRKKSDKTKDDPYHIYREYGFIPYPVRASENDPMVFFKTYLFKCTCGNKNKSEWESALKNAEDGENCDACGKHVVPYERLIGVTPYQGNDRVFASFKCHKCTRIWHSAYSWSNESQKCEVCMIRVYPFDQNHLKRGKKNEMKGHQKELCGKCISIRADCTKLNPKPNGKNSRKSRQRKVTKKRGGGKALDAITDVLTKALATIKIA